MIRILRFMIILNFVLLLTISCSNFSSKLSKDNSDSLQTKALNNKKVIVNTDERKDFLQLGSELMNKEKFGDIKLEMSLIETINKLGEPEEKTKAEFWSADGMYHQTLRYKKKGIELDIQGEKDLDKVINMITITKPSTLKTLKNIGIGSSYEDVEFAYKDVIDPEFSNSESIVAGSIYGGIIFSFENKRVNSVFIGASAE